MLGKYALRTTDFRGHAEGSILGGFVLAALRVHLHPDQRSGSSSAPG
jgi:hypothetical protein